MVGSFTHLLALHCVTLPVYDFKFKKMHVFALKHKIFYYIAGNNHSNSYTNDKHINTPPNIIISIFNQNIGGVIMSKFSKKVILAAITAGGVIIAICNPCLAADQFSKIDQGGMKILTIVRRIGYWIILVKCISDLIRAGMAGDNHAVGKIIFQYVLIYGALFFVPWALRLVEGIF